MNWRFWKREAKATAEDVQLAQSQYDKAFQDWLHCNVDNEAEMVDRMKNAGVHLEKTIKRSK